MLTPPKNQSRGGGYGFVASNFCNDKSTTCFTKTAPKERDPEKHLRPIHICNMAALRFVTLWLCGRLYR